MHAQWWPGTLGKVANHALVYANLILDGKELGVHIFMVQIRDENHRPLPGAFVNLWLLVVGQLVILTCVLIGPTGIELGDLGPKLGDGANDTGFMRLENIRVPREHMLAKVCARNLYSLRAEHAVSRGSGAKSRKMARTRRRPTRARTRCTTPR